LQLSGRTRIIIYKENPSHHTPFTKNSYLAGKMQILTYKKHMYTCLVLFGRKSKKIREK